MTPDPVLFEAAIQPHRSLSRRGLRLLMAALALVCAADAAVFIAIGAWPVGGFAGLELLLAALLLRSNSRAARAREALRLTSQSLTVIRTDIHGRTQQRELSAAWLTVQLEERAGRVPGLFLGSGGQREEVARSLGEEEKRDLARALTGALHRWRNPVFENPQLAE